MEWKIFILIVGVFFMFPFITSLSLDSTVILNTSVSNSSMTFSIGVNVSEVLVESTYIYLTDVSYVQNGETKTCSSINYSTANTNLDSANFPCDGGGSSEIISGGGYPAFNPTEEQLNKGYEKIMYKGWKISFKVENGSHIFKVENITETTAKISVSSETQEAILSIGEEKKFEVSGDNYYDLLVQLNSIEASNKFNPKANFTIQTIHEEIPAIPQKKQKPPVEIEKSKWWIWLIVGSGIIILVFVKIYLIKHLKKRKK